MKTLRKFFLLAGPLMFFLSFSPAAFPQENLFQPPGDPFPVTHLKFANHPDDFRFAVIADRTGGQRPGIFEPAVSALNLLRPEFVISVGDSIEGYVEDREKIEAQWAEFDGIVNRLKMPFFRIVGNHDINYPVTQDIWQKRYGLTYYHFVYKNVLFLCMNTDDPPMAPTEEMIKEYTDYQKAIAAETDPAEKKKRIEEFTVFEANSLTPRISADQIDYFDQAIAAHPTVRWTFVFLHKPAWETTAGEPNGFEQIEAMLGKRPYTIIAGHEHSYRYAKRKGRDYIRIATTGGGYPMTGRENTFDHIMWVAMTDHGPVMANLLTTGLVDKTGKGIQQPSDSMGGED